MLRGTNVRKACILLACLAGLELGAVAVFLTQFKPPKPSQVTVRKLTAIPASVQLPQQAVTVLGFWGPEGHSTIRVYPPPTPLSSPAKVISDGHGGFWFTEQQTSLIGHMQADTRIREYRVPTIHSQPFAISLDGRGGVWFTELATGKIGRLDPGRAVMEFKLPESNSQPYAIVADGHGGAWFAEYAAGKIGHLDAGNRLREYPLRSATAQPAGITVGPDGNIWFTEASYGYSAIGRITPEGQISEFPLSSRRAQPFGIISTGGAMWFTEYQGGLGVITTSGRITEFRMPALVSALDPYDLTAADGAIWFTELTGDQLASFSLRGGHPVIHEYPLPAQANVGGIAAGAHGQLWLAEPDLNALGRFTPRAATG